MKITRYSLLLLLGWLFLMVAGAALSDDAWAASDAGVWDGIMFTDALHEGKSGPKLWLDLHARRNTTQMLNIVRPGIGWDFSKGVNVTVGYAFVPVYANGTGKVTGDNRLWEQLTLSHTFEDKVNLSLRNRLEQRLHFTEPGMELRWRIQGRVGLPIKGIVGASIWDELFLGLNKVDWASQGFDQNRAFVGPYLAPNKQVRIEAGYLNVPVRKEGVTTMNHIMAMNLFLAL